MTDYEDPIEKQIRQAMEHGEFDDLPGSGRRLDLGDDEPAWWAKRKLEEMRRRDRLIESAREIDRERDRIWTLPDEAYVRAEVADLNRRIEQVSRTLGPDASLDPIDPEEALRIWRRMRRIRTP